MKLFISEQKLSESGDDLFDSLLSLIDPKYIRNKAQILHDILLHESLKGGNCARFRSVFVHTARTQGISDFCLASSETKDGNLEVLILWNDISEHHLGRLAEIADFFERVANQQKPNAEIIAELKKLAL